MPHPVSPVERRLLGALIFLIAFVVRLAFWQATPDRDWPHSVAFKGDAVVWADYAQAIARDAPFELGLPLRPPGNAYLLSLLGVESSADAWRAKPVWCFLGALTVLLFFRVALAQFGLAVGLVVGLSCSFSSALLALSTSLNNETPYLTLVAALVVLASKHEDQPPLGTLVAWGGLNALACLFRVEHLVFFVLGSLWILTRGSASAGRKSRRRIMARRTAVVLGVFVLVLLPWHVHAWRALRTFNTELATLDPGPEAAQRSVEAATRGLVWTSEAQDEREKLPGFARRSAANFVAATVLVRGGREVDAEDFEILEQAFGSRPRSLPTAPFVAVYGPLNFYLAHHGGAPPGFDPEGLDRLPVLEGGIDRYPHALLAGLPPGDLNFNYPPHVELVTDGYRLGWTSIRAHPAEATRRTLARLDLLWQGASHGWTGYALPWGGNALRRAVDLGVPEGTSFAIGRFILLMVCGFGLWRARSHPGLVPWLLPAAPKLVATVFFFGYARHGAALVPLVALLAGLFLAWVARLERLSKRKLLAGAAVLAVLGLGVELVRWATPPHVEIDDRSIERGDPHPLRTHADRRITID